MTHKPYTEEFKQNIVDKYKSGSKVADLSKKYNVASSTIYRWVKERVSQNNKTSSTHNFDFSGFAGAKNAILGDLSTHNQLAKSISTAINKEHLIHAKRLSQLTSISAMNIPKMPKFDFVLPKIDTSFLKASQNVLKIGAMHTQTLGALSNFEANISKCFNVYDNLFNQVDILNGLGKKFLEINQAQQDMLRSFSKSIVSTFGDSFKQFERIDKYVLCNLPMYGWYMHFDFTVSTSVIYNHLQEGNEATINDMLMRYYMAIFDEHIEKLSESNENRKALFQQIKEAYYQKMYFLVIPAILTQIDGICDDTFKEYFFIKDTDKKSEYQYLPKVLPLLMEILENFGLVSQFENTDSPIYAHESRLIGKVNVLNRHRVIHGRDYNYGTQQNTLKAFSLLICIAELCSMAKEPEDFEDKQQESTG